MCMRLSAPGLRFNSGSLSLTRMPGGMVHVGLNTTYVMVERKIGVSRSSRPTMTLDVQIGSSFLKYET